MMPRGEWVKVDKLGPYPIIEKSFLIMSEDGMVFIGFNCFDYYDAEYWCLFPRMPK